MTVRRAKRLCAPANKKGEDETAPTHPGHLTSYTIRQTEPAHLERQRDVVVVNQFGESTVDVAKPERLLVPTAKGLDGTPPALVDPIDHFKCYRVRRASFRQRGIEVQTQFSTSVVDIIRPLHLCVPADKNDEGHRQPDRSPDVLPGAGAAAERPRPGVHAQPVRQDDNFNLFGVRELCVPSMKNPGVCGDGELNFWGEECEPPVSGTCPGTLQCSQTCTCVAGTLCGNQSCEPIEDGDTQDEFDTYCGADCCDNGTCSLLEADDHDHYCAADCCDDGTCSFPEAFDHDHYCAADCCGICSAHHRKPPVPTTARRTVAATTFARRGRLVDPSTARLTVAEMASARGRRSPVPLLRGWTVAEMASARGRRRSASATARRTVAAMASARGRVEWTPLLRGTVAEMGCAHRQTKLPAICLADCPA